jgi:hypothetical protein
MMYAIDGLARVVDVLYMDGGEPIARTHEIRGTGRLPLLLS